MQSSTFNNVSYSWLIGILAGLGILILVGPVLIVMTTSMMESMLDVRIGSIAGGLLLATPVLVIVLDWLIGLTKRMSVSNPEPHDLPRPGDWP